MAHGPLASAKTQPMVKTPGDHLDSEWAVVAAEAKNVVALRLLKDHEILVPHGRHDRTKVVLLGEVVLALGFQVILGEAVRALVLGLHVIHGAILNLKFQAVQVEEVVQVILHLQVNQVVIVPAEVGLLMRGREMQIHRRKPWETAEHHRVK